MEHASQGSSLLGGRTNAEVVRIGNTVRRSQGENSKFAHTLLKILEEKGFNHAPKFLGIDEKGREILTYIEGEVLHQEPTWTEEQLVEIAKMIKELHDATAGSELTEGKEVVCHNDIAPWNTVVKNETPIAFIDFDDAAPGNRVDDLAYFLWTFLDLGSDVPIEIQSAKIKIVCDTYGFNDGPKLVDAILEQQNKILVKRKDLAQNDKTVESREFSLSRIPIITSHIEWVEKHREALENIL